MNHKLTITALGPHGDRPNIAFVLELGLRTFALQHRLTPWHGEIQ
ncbi:hypothetical protein [Aeromonas eucrenophila]|uniref:Uncharacterized protein n=1 Tax=Aeromonas eucrenophila TaxID=649 RepID=A0ABW0Y8Q2_9GAMM|nr:hypothetical protein [Aeromonas eucrenophila]